MSAQHVANLALRRELRRTGNSFSRRADRRRRPVVDGLERRELLSSDLTGVPLPPTLLGSLRTAATGSADISITTKASTSSAQWGDTFNYTITLTNTGPDTATNVVATIPLPQNIAYTGPNGGPSGL